MPQCNVISVLLQVISFEDQRDLVILLFNILSLWYDLFVLQLHAGDGLPAQVCQQCVHEVNNSYNFRLQCESSDFTLRQYLSTDQSEKLLYHVSVAVVITIIFMLLSLLQKFYYS
jgi:hypothetical protein